MTRREFERRMVTAASNHAAGVRRDLVEISAEMRAADAALRRKRDAATLVRRTCALRALLEAADQRLKAPESTIGDGTAHLQDRPMKRDVLRNFS